jgi:hypothetical protein
MTNIIKEKKFFLHLKHRKNGKIGQKNPKNLFILKKPPKKNKAMKRKQKQKFFFLN